MVGFGIGEVTMQEGIKKQVKQIVVVRYEVPTDPQIEVFGVEITNGESSWKETAPSAENLRWFVKGVQAGASVFGNVYVGQPEIPMNAESIPE